MLCVSAQAPARSPMRAEKPAMLSKLRVRAREAANAMGARRKDLSVKNEPLSLDRQELRNVNL